MADEYENFRNIVAASPKLSARWDATAEHVISLAKAEMNVTLSREDVIALPAARLATLTEDGLSDSWRDEASKLLAVVSDHNARAKLRADLQNGDEAAHAELSRMPRAARISAARELGLIGENTTEANMPSTEATKIRMLLSLSPAKRISLAREWGLVS